MRRWASFAAVAGLLTLPSCIGYVRYRIDEPVHAAQLAPLQSGATTLGDALAAVGAPTAVLEYRGDGVVLVYAWEDRGDWSLDVSLPVSDSASASFELDLSAKDRPGAVLWFDAELRLERWRLGRLGELLGSRLRPAAAD